MNAAILADVVAGIHLASVAFIVVGQVLILVGWALRWRWIRNAWFRFIHLGVMVYVAQNAARGKLCFLTHIEWDLRKQAGQEGHEGSWIGRILHNILFVDVPQSTLDRYYLGFFAIVVLCFLGAPPRLRRRRGASVDAGS